MGFAQAVSTAFANYFNFSGRARRPEYWYFGLFVFIVGIVAALVDIVLGYPDLGPASVVYTLAIIIPSISVSVRRLHDIGRSGWWSLLALIPIVGIIILIYWACLPGEPGTNQYGSLQPA